MSTRTLEQVLLYPCDDVARFVERLAVDEQTGNLAFSAGGDERLLGFGIGRDIALGNGHAVIRQKGNKDVQAIEESAEDQIDEGFTYEESGNEEYQDFDKMVDDIFAESASDDSEEIFGKEMFESGETEFAAADDFDTLLDEAFAESEDDSDMFDAESLFEESAGDDLALYEELLGSI